MHYMEGPPQQLEQKRLRVLPVFEEGTQESQPHNCKGMNQANNLTELGNELFQGWPLRTLALPEVSTFRTPMF